MSVEKALIVKSQPFFLVSRAEALIKREAAKGCSPEIYPLPVCLEPRFSPIMQKSLALLEEPQGNYLNPSLSDKNEPIRLQVWISPEQEFSWIKSELFLKGLKNLNNRTGLEISGNKENIEISFLLSGDNLSQFTTAFKSQFNQCELTPNNTNQLSQLRDEDWQEAQFLDFYPLPPYSHLFTQPDELKLSPFETIFTALSTIEPPAIGFYQLLFQGTDSNNNWHQNINILNDFEYALKLMTGLPMSSKYPFQSPSGELKGMAFENEKKAHNDKPIFAAAMKIGIVGGKTKEDLSIKGLSLFANLFQHGGRPLSSLSQDDYIEDLDADSIKEMFIKGYTYRPGFILNSAELSGMVHLPPKEIFKQRKTNNILLETLPVKNDLLLEGTPIGTCDYAGTEKTVCIPSSIRSRSTHLIARHGMGKSTVIEHMVLDDIKTGAGVAVLDPHGDLIERLLQLIPEEYVDKTIYLFPGDQEWVPLWNPIHVLPNQDISRTADNIIAAIKNIVQGWGDRLENLLRHAIYALLQVPGSSLLDVSQLLRSKSKESNRLIQEIEKVVDNETSRTFWQHDFPHYKDSDLSPPQHKLSKLLMSGTVSLMLSQPENRINFREIMDTGKILLVDLSGLGSDVRELLGSFMLSLLHITAISRSDIPIDQRKQFHIYCDEAHRFLTSSLEDLVVETRKFAVSLTLAHQYLRQFDPKMVDAILSAGSTIIFNVDMNDARYLIKDLRGQVKPEDLASFEIGEAIARIHTDIVKIETKKPLPIPEINYREKIIAESHKKYYKPIKEIKAILANRDGYHEVIPQINKTVFFQQNPEEEKEEFVYEEFE
jgi:hypothetical protein